MDVVCHGERFRQQRLQSSECRAASAGQRVQGKVEFSANLTTQPERGVRLVVQFGSSIEAAVKIGGASPLVEEEIA